jgi:hypothetical protein
MGKGIKIASIRQDGDLKALLVLFWGFWVSLGADSSVKNF